MQTILDVVKPRPEARWVVFYSLGDGPDSGKYYDAHPIEQMGFRLTMLAYDMNGEPLSFGHGAPLRLRNETQLRLYLSSLEALSADLAKAGRAQAALPEDRRMDPYRLLRWHAETVQRAFQGIDQENARLQKSYQQKLIDYENRHTRIMSYIGLAAGAVAIFVFTIFLFVIIRIERDLRAMAVASMATTKQLES